MAHAGGERAESLTRGTRVVVAGRLQMRSWETQEGDKRTVVEIEADEIGPEPALGDGQGRTPGPFGFGDWSAPVGVGASTGDEETPLDATQG